MFGWLRRGGSRTEPGPAQRDELENLYSLASEAWVAGALPEAERLARKALALDAGMPALHYLLGAILLDRGEVAGAIAALEACLDRTPDYPLAQHARARLAVSRMRSAPYDPPLEQLRAAPGRISVIVCSITPAKFERVSRNYSELLAGLPHEVIGIHDARSLSEGYNRGVARAHGDLLVFSHDDIEILAPDFGAKLVNRLSEFDLIGVAGTDRLCGGSWVDAGWPHVFGQVGMRAAGGIVAGTYVLRGTSAAPMQALDGVMFACRRSAYDAIRFDESTFDGWHLYDLDFSYSCFLAGLRAAVCNDLLLVHDSGGSFGAAWLGMAQRFMAKHRIPAAEGYRFRGVDYCPVMTRSLPEWRSFTHYMSAMP